MEPELVKWSKNTIKKSDLKNIEIIQADEILGYPKQAPFDRILVSDRLIRACMQKPFRIKA